MAEHHDGEKRIKRQIINWGAGGDIFYTYHRQMTNFITKFKNLL